MRIVGSIERGVAAIPAADVAGFGRLVGLDEEPDRAAVAH